MQHKKDKNLYLAIFCMIFGFLLLMYPTVSNFVNSRHSSRVITEHTETLKNLDDETFEIEKERVVAHNELLAAQGFLAAGADLEQRDDLQTYNDLLNLSNNHVMGSISIPKIRVELPIYHTTDESVLQVAVGHYVGTSLPMGGTSTHVVLSGHRGLPSAELFTELDKLELGDYFYLEVLDEKLAYKVDQIETIDPEEYGHKLDIVDGKDYVTLLTCTPYGVNTDRLLVRGHRVPYEEKVEKKEVDKGKTVVRLAILHRFLILFLSIVVALYFALRLGVLLADKKIHLPVGKNK